MVPTMTPKAHASDESYAGSHLQHAQSLELSISPQKRSIAHMSEKPVVVAEVLEQELASPIRKRRITMHEELEKYPFEGQPALISSVPASSEREPTPTPAADPTPTPIESEPAPMASEATPSEAKLTLLGQDAAHDEYKSEQESLAVSTPSGPLRDTMSADYIGMLFEQVEMKSHLSIQQIRKKQLEEQVKEMKMQIMTKLNDWVLNKCKEVNEPTRRRQARVDHLYRHLLRCLRFVRRLKAAGKARREMRETQMQSIKSTMPGTIG